MRKATVYPSKGATSRANSNRQTTKIIDPPEGIWTAFCLGGHARRGLRRKKNQALPRLYAQSVPICQGTSAFPGTCSKGRFLACGTLDWCPGVPLNSQTLARNVATVVVEHVGYFIRPFAASADLASLQDAASRFVYQLLTRDFSHHSPPVYSDGYVINAIKYQLWSDRRGRQNMDEAIRLLHAAEDDGNRKA